MVFQWTPGINGLIHVPLQLLFSLSALWFTFRLIAFKLLIYSCLFQSEYLTFYQGTFFSLVWVSLAFFCWKIRVLQEAVAYNKQVIERDQNSTISLHTVISLFRFLRFLRFFKNMLGISKARNFSFKISNGNTRAKYEICTKLAIRHQNNVSKFSSLILFIVGNKNFSDL